MLSHTSGGDMNPRRWLIFGLLAAAQFMVILDASVITVALASIQEDLGFTASDLQWVVNAYVIPFGGLLLLGGRVADLVGRKATFLAGLAVFSVASLAGGLAQSELWLIAARAAQGIGAAFMAPAALSLVMTLFADEGERTKALGLWGAVSGAGGAAGVLAGGTLTELLGWESTLLVNVPIGLALSAAVARTVRESRVDDAGSDFDVAGALTVVAGVATLIYGIVNANETGWGSFATLGTLAAAVALLTAFVVIEERAQNPLVDLRLLTSRTIGGANLVSLIVASALHPMFYFGGLLMQQALGFSALGSGVAWLPMSLLVMATAGGLAPKLIARFGPAPVLTGGALALAGGLLAWAHAATSGGYVEGVLPALLITAPGVGLVFVSVTVAATSGVAPQSVRSRVRAGQLDPAARHGHRHRGPGRGLVVADEPRRGIRVGVHARRRVRGRGCRGHRVAARAARSLRRDACGRSRRGMRFRGGGRPSGGSAAVSRPPCGRAFGAVAPMSPFRAYAYSANGAFISRSTVDTGW